MELEYNEEDVDFLIVCGKYLTLDKFKLFKIQAKMSYFDFPYIGGDGTLLLGASLFTKQVPPIIGFKAGNVNYLLHHDLNNFESLFESVFSGKSIIFEQLQRLVSNVSKGKKKTIFAVNEVKF